MIRLIAKREILHAQRALFVAIALQFVVWNLNGDELVIGPQYVLIPIEIALALIIGLVSQLGARKHPLYHLTALGLLAMVSFANISSLILVLHALIIQHAAITGPELLGAAIAIFMTNIIIYALWYWEIDSPGLSSTRWSRNDQDFQFPQQDMPEKFPRWRAEFTDYLYLSIVNAVNFAPADSKPLTHGAKMLMASQALVSVFTLALVIARSVSILGN
jgi:uncharacterized membrane protein